MHRHMDIIFHNIYACMYMQYIELVLSSSRPEYTDVIGPFSCYIYIYDLYMHVNCF